MTVGEKMKQYRKEMKLTQKQLGELAGSSEAMIRQYELGLRNPKIESIEKIATALGVNSFDLIGYDISKDLRDFEAIEKYLQSIGYIVKVEKADQSGSGYYEDHKDDEGNIIGRSFIADEEFISVRIVKDGLEVEFSKAEFEVFQRELKNFASYQIDQRKK